MVKVFYFYHPSLCAVCPRQLADFMLLSQQYAADGFTFVPYSSENESAQQLMELYDLQYVPSILIDKNGKTVKTLDGIDTLTADNLVDEIYKATGISPEGLGNFGGSVTRIIKKIPVWGWVLLGVLVVAAFVFFGKWKKYKFLKFIK